MLTHDTLITALEQRFDFHSARVVAQEARALAGLDERHEYSEDELRKLAEYLPLGDRDLLPVLHTLGLTEPASA